MSLCRLWNSIPVGRNWHQTGLCYIPDFAFDALKILLDSAASPEGFLSWENIENIPGDIPRFLETEKFPAVWKLILKNTPQNHQARYRAFCRWFDGLKTLRFLHACQRTEQKTTADGV